MSTTKEEFEVVERPSRSTTILEGVKKALMETLDTGKAIKIKLEPDQSYLGWQSSMRAWIMRQGDGKLRLRTQHDKRNKEVTAWVVDVSEKEKETEE